MTTRQVTIRGHVQNFSTKNSISKAQVNIFDYNRGSWVSSDLSDANGNYSITVNLEIGANNQVQISALAQKEGFAPSGRKSSSRRSNITVNFWLIVGP